MYLSNLIKWPFRDPKSVPWPPVHFAKCPMALYFAYGPVAFLADQHGGSISGGHKGVHRAIEYPTPKLPRPMLLALPESLAPASLLVFRLESSP